MKQRDKKRKQRSTQASQSAKTIWYETIQLLYSINLKLKYFRAIYNLYITLCVLAGFHIRIISTWDNQYCFKISRILLSDPLYASSICALRLVSLFPCLSSRAEKSRRHNKLRQPFCYLHVNFVLFERVSQLTTALIMKHPPTVIL